MAPGPADQPSEDDYRRLLEFRTGLRRFLHWSEEQAEAVGITPAQHQLLLAIRGYPDPAGPTMRDVADALLLRHHSAVGLVDRAEHAHLVERCADTVDGRFVRLRLTTLGQQRIGELSAAHLEELARLAPRLQALWDDLDSPPAASG